MKNTIDFTDPDSIDKNVISAQIVKYGSYRSVSYVLLNANALEKSAPTAMPST